MAERKNIPPLTETERESTSQSLDKRRTNSIRNYPPVPMDERRAEVVECLKQNPNAVIIGETGSGKTTRIPDFLLESFPEARIAVTQPRRVAARSVARYVAERRGGKVGEEVGYQVRFEDTTTEGTRVNFMTDGILLRKLQFDPLLEEYDVVMVDEAHERSLNIDFVLGLLRRVQAERQKRGMKELKVIATSATIEKEKFANYFGNSPTLEVPGRMFPVDVYYEPETPRDPTVAAAQKVKEIVTSGSQGDVLIFMPGEEEIRRTISEIETLKLPDVETMPLFGAIAPEDQDRIFEKNSKRKVIVSTNIAETSVTIDGIRFVIDSGLIKQKEFNPNTGIEALLTKRHAKSGCEQRKGRAGRTAPGACYRLYTEVEYNNREEYQNPEIARSNLDHVILAMKKIGIEDVRGFEFIDRPKEEAIAQAIETLKMLGALDANEKLTEVGRTMAELPLKPEIARMVIEAQKYHCVGKICTIAAMMGGKSVFVRPKEKEREADATHAQFSQGQGGSDFMKLLEVWNQWSASGFDERWARNHFLNVGQLFEVREIRAQLMRELKRQNIAANDQNGKDPIAIQKCIASGLIQHLMVYTSRHAYERAVRTKSSSSTGSVFIHPSSSAFSEAPKLMVGADIVTTSKTFARRCQPVKPEWLPEIAPQLLEEDDKSVRYVPETDSVIEKVSYSLKGRYGTLIEQERMVTDDAVATEQFIRALVAGSVDLPSVKHNTEVVRVLQTLYARSGGRVHAPELSAWYKERINGVQSKKEASYIDEQLRLNMSEFYSPEMKVEIDRLYPETIEVHGYTLKVDYEYRPANPNGWSESEKLERFKATITVPSNILFTLEVSDFPSIGSQGRPEVIYRSGDNYNAPTNTNLEELKVTVDNKRLENAWYSFQHPEAQVIQMVPGQALPALENLGALPIAYAKNYKDEDVFAYPAYHAEQIYDYNQQEYVYRFTVSYSRTEDEAKRKTDRAMEYKNQEDAKFRRKQERETLLAPTKERYTIMRATMDSLYDSYASYGLNHDDYNQLNSKWREVSYALENSDADPVKAIDLMDEIQKTIDCGQQERNRRISLIPDIQARIDVLTDKIGKITYDNYIRFGLNYDQYNDLSRKWREVSDALKTEDCYGRPILPDPERASSILTELTTIIPDEQKFTPEQEELIQILTDKNASYAKVLRVRDGRVTEFYSPSRPTEVTQNPTDIPIGSSGRSLAIRGSRVVFVYGSGREEGSWQLADGDYLVGRNASTFLRIEENKDAPYGLHALEFIDQTYEEQSSQQDRRSGIYSNSRPYYEESRDNTGEKIGTGVFASLLSKLTGKQEAPKPAKPETPTRVVREVKQVEKEKMTEGLRKTLIEDLINARFFLDTVRAVPEPNKKTAIADKISKVRARAAEIKRDLNSIEQELVITDDAARARGKVVDIVRRAKRAAEEMARLKNNREDWPDRFKTFMEKLGEIAKTQNVALDAPTLEKIKAKVAELATQRGELADLDGELESIIIDSI